ncbi:hypothetical protein E2C01_080380 [Portunus trituberculatus]|uniref:Uncharacterized protein n=1 Tax=Portunus trituberculatus TaxID=210409 RepID=A0A5B7ITY9_PORTR|nr:hypothetical protein [Portunus trituberculatus]
MYVFFRPSKSGWPLSDEPRGRKQEMNTRMTATCFMKRCIKSRPNFDGQGGYELVTGWGQTDNLP